MKSYYTNPLRECIFIPSLERCQWAESNLLDLNKPLNVNGLISTFKLQTVFQQKPMVKFIDGGE